MKIAIAADHAGFALKEQIRELLAQSGHDVLDLGARNADPSDYPDFAECVGEQLMKGDVHRGILICGSGIGVCVAANKMPGVRAGICHDTYSAHQGVEHDDMNALVMGSRIVGSALAWEIVQAYMGAGFDASQARFVRRLKKVKAIERHYMLPAEK